MKFIAPKIEEIPAMCKLPIANSILAPEWANEPLSGGYTVQPVPTPSSTNADKSNKNIEGGSSQNDRLFNLGKDISGLPIKIGTYQLPKAPTSTGITKKKIIIKACAVTITLYSWEFPRRNWLPGWASSKRISIDNKVPTLPAYAPKPK